MHNRQPGEGSPATIPYVVDGLPKASRYQIYALIGRGSSGLVYKALDRVRNLPIALKSLHSMSPEEIYALKTEFRTLSDIYHPNLAQLLDLHVDEDRCYFTMELLEGRDFARFMRGNAGGSDAELDYSLLRSLVGQLADGLDALHDYGVLHRDIKPSNVLVEPDARVVLLDFGLSIQQLARMELTRSRVLAGTPAYMAPELYRLEQPTRASDWYSVGVMLFETLTGRRPFPDSGTELAKFLEAHERAPPDPRTFNSSVPEDVRVLVMRLLAVNSDDRPTAAEVRDCVGRRQGPSPAGRIGRLHLRGSSFVGRASELERLRAALARAQGGVLSPVCVAGVPGVGKTTLIEQFLSGMPEIERALILRSRCHEHEEVRYKALDGLVDSLSHFLKLQDSETLAALTPVGVLALTKVFPVLARVSFELPPAYAPLSADPHVNLERAFVALYESLRSIVASRPVVLWVDDLQWTDAASVPHLRSLLERLAAASSGEAVPLVLLSYRSDVDDSLLAELLGGMPREQIDVEPLASPESRQLIEELSATPANAARVSDALVNQAGGLPIFVMELAHYLQSRAGSHAPSDSLTFERVLHERLEPLPRAERDLLELVAVAKRPIPEDLLIELIGQEAARHGMIYALCRQRLLRRSLTNGLPTVECFHDQLRLAVAPAEGSERRAECHRRIAALMPRMPRQRYHHTHRSSFDAQSRGDHFEMLFEQSLGAGHGDKAARYAIAASKAAASRLAFERAVELCEIALNLRDRGPSDWPLRTTYARALANCGRSADAAQQYVQIAQAIAEDAGGVAGSSRALLVAGQQARAAEQYLYAGLLTDGLRLLRSAFSALRLPFPKQGRVARLLSYQNRIGSLPVVLGLATFNPRTLDARSGANDALRLDTLWIAAKGMVMLDYAVGDVMTSRYLKEALALGESSRALRAMGLEASVYANIGGNWMLRRSDALMARARKLALVSPNPYDKAMMHICDTTIAWCRGQWRQCQEPARLALAALAQCAGTSFDVAIVQGFALSARAFLGELPALREDVAKLLADARRRGDRYIQNVFESGYLVYLHLADDDPDRALRMAEATLQHAPRDRFTSLHLHYFNAYTAASLYAGDASGAWQHVVSNWRHIGTVGFLKLDCIGTLLRDVRARAAIAVAATQHRDQRGAQSPRAGRSTAALKREWLLRIAAADAARIARRSLPPSAGIAATLRAGIAAVRGDTAAQRAELQTAARQFGISEMAMHEEAAKLRLATLENRAADRSAALAALRSRGVREPDKLARLLVPGPD
jgi:hypothetical protein